MFLCRRRHKASRAVVAFLLAFAMGFGMTTGTGMTSVQAADTQAENGTVASSDADTTTSYKDSLGNGTSTRYAGRVWTDKTVYTGNAVFTNDENDNTIEVEKSEDADFLISYSALVLSGTL